MIEFAVYGLIGGLVRGVVGLTKMKVFKKKFDAYRFVFTLATSAVIGAFAGTLVVGDFRISLLAGYAGTDFIEGLWQMRKKSWHV